MTDKIALSRVRDFIRDRRDFTSSAVSGRTYSAAEPVVRPPQAELDGWDRMLNRYVDRAFAHGDDVFAVVAEGHTIGWVVGDGDSVVVEVHGSTVVDKKQRALARKGFGVPYALHRSYEGVVQGDLTCYRFQTGLTIRWWDQVRDQDSDSFMERPLGYSHNV